jgi:hypothetical protein
MIRERVAIHGAVRPLEAEEDLPALQVVPEILGAIPKHLVWRYIAAKERHKKKYVTRINHIAKRRDRAIAKLRQSSQICRNDSEEAAVSSGWSLHWALDADELPPPSSLVARCDTAQAFKLACNAKRHLQRADSALSKKRQEARRRTAGMRAFWRGQCLGMQVAGQPQPATA